jgi:hypothetical protein
MDTSKPEWGNRFQFLVFSVLFVLRLPFKFYAFNTKSSRSFSKSLRWIYNFRQWFSEVHIFIVSISPIFFIGSAIISPRIVMCIPSLSQKNYTCKVHVQTHGSYLCLWVMLVVLFMGHVCGHVHRSCSLIMFVGNDYMP